MTTKNKLKIDQLGMELMLTTAELEVEKLKVEKLTEERDAALEIIDYMRNKYSPINGRGCVLCVYDNGVFQRSCKFHESSRS